MSLVVQCNTPDETMTAGAEFSRQLKGGSVVALHGQLGTGKTTFVKGMVRGLGIQSDVTSPTFALIQEYGVDPKLIHMDCYREHSLQRWLSLGIHDYFESDAIVVIEWAEVLTDLLPASSVHVQFEYRKQGTGRVIRIDEETGD